MSLLPCTISAGIFSWAKAAAAVANAGAMGNPESLEFFEKLAAARKGK